MSRVNPPGVQEVHWVVTIATLTAPTSTELNAGTDLTAFARTVPTIPETGNTADTASLADKFNTRIAASRGGDNFSCEFYMDDATDTAYDTLVPETQGHFAVGRYGLATPGTWAIGDEVWVYQVEILSRVLGVPGRDEADFFTCEAAIQAVPTDKFTLAA